VLDGEDCLVDIAADRGVGRALRLQDIKRRCRFPSRSC
jgi:hypothetical protein